MRSELIKKIEKQAVYELKNYPYKQKGIKTELRYFYDRIVHGIKSNEDHYTWANALVAKGFYDLYVKDRDEKYLCIVKDYCDELLRNHKEIKQLDDVLNGYLMELLLRIDYNERYAHFSEKCISFLKQAASDIKGSFFYRPEVSKIVIIDALGMVCPFLFAYSVRTGDKWSFDVACKQIGNYFMYGFDKTTFLPYHGYDLNTGIKYGVIGWGRALGWLMMALIESIACMNENCKTRKSYLESLEKIIKVVIDYQSAEGYIKWQLQATDGPDDSSATAMIFYAIAKIRIYLELSIDVDQAIQLAIMAIDNAVVDGKDTKCSGESGGYGKYSQNYGSYPWGTGSILSFLSVVELKEDWK